MKSAGIEVGQGANRGHAEDGPEALGLPGPFSVKDGLVQVGGLVGVPPGLDRFLAGPDAVLDVSLDVEAADAAALAFVSSIMTW